MQPITAIYNCPLCGAENASPYHKDKKREYFHCGRCALVFVPKHFHLSREKEKAVYDLHQNNPDDAGYRRFLSRLSNPLLSKLSPNRSGLDFGCGPGPALARMIEEAGHKMAVFDPYYANEPAVIAQKYDFITATEVVEHLSSPEHIFNLLFGMLEHDGYLGVMTKMVIDREAFKCWHYIQDETHNCFYSRETFEYLSNKYNASLEFFAKDVILMRKIS